MDNQQNNQQYSGTYQQNNQQAGTYQQNNNYQQQNNQQAGTYQQNNNYQQQNNQQVGTYQQTNQQNGGYQQQTSQQNARLLPQNIDAEKAVLAACILSSAAVEEIAPKLIPENFYRPSHKIIFESIMDLYKRHIAIDHISIVENLKGKGQLDAIGGTAYLLDLASDDFALTNWRTHADIVKRQSVLRDLVFASNKIQQLAYDAPDDLSEVVGEAEKTLFNVTERKLSSDFVKVDKLLSDSFEELQELSRHKGQMAGVPTGFRDLDELFYGLRGGDLVILAARPGVGKTSFALNLAVNAAKEGTTVAFLSLEMGANQLIQRILCTEAQLDLSRIRSGKIGDNDWSTIVQASGRLGELPLLIDDTPGLSIFELRAKARRELRHVQNGKGLILVDYLQLMQPPTHRRDGNRAVEVAEISRGLKILAKEMNIPVIALSQLSRNVEVRGARGTKGKPQLSDLRESGSIEQDADIVMFIDRSMNVQEAEDENRPDWNTAEIDVAKHRNGPTKLVTLRFDPQYTKFSDLARGYNDDDVMGYVGNQYADPNQPSPNQYLNPQV